MFGYLASLVCDYLLNGRKGPALIKAINLKCKLYKKWIKTRKAADKNRYSSHAKLLRRDLHSAENFITLVNLIPQ